MKHFKMLGLALVAMFTVGLMATVASAGAITLPDVSMALGGAFPLHLNITVNSEKTHLETTGSSALEGEGVLILLLSKELSSSGTFEVLFLKVTEPAEKVKCSTTGDKEGEVLTKGTFHIVPLPPLGGTTLGVLYEPEEVMITCGTVKIKVKGLVLSSLSAGTEATELTEVGGKLEKGASKGLPKLNKYLNNAGEEKTATLTSNFGSGNLTSAEIFNGEPKPLALEGKMFVITGRTS